MVDYQKFCTSIRAVIAVIAKEASPESQAELAVLDARVARLAEKEAAREGAADNE